MAVKKQITTKAFTSTKTKPKKNVLVKKVTKSQKAITVPKLPKKSLANPKNSVRKSKNQSQSRTNTKVIKARRGVAISKDNIEPTLSLPTNMSQRAVEKTIVFKREFDHYFRDSAYKVAYVTGICFLLVGSSLMASQAMTPGVSNLMSSEAISSGVLNSPSEVPSAVITILDNVPEHLVEPYQFTFSVTNESKFRVFLSKEGDKSFSNLTYEKLPGDMYRVNLIPSLYSNGDYRIQISAINLDQVTNVFKRTNIFHVGPIEKIEDTVKPDNNTNPTEEVIDSVSTESAEKTIQTTSVSTKDVLFELKKPVRDALTGSARIIVSVPDNYSYIDLYTRQVNSLESIHIDRAEFLLGEWVFNFNTKNLLNGDYEFFAVSKHDGKQVETKPITLNIFNPIQKVITEPSKQTDDFPRSKYDGFYDQTGVLGDTTDETVPLRIVEKNNYERETERLLSENKTEFDDLQKRLSVALQSGDSILIEVARRAIQDRRKEIIYSTLGDPELREISDDIDKEIDKWIVDVEKRIDTFERIRKERSDGKTSVDTDGDGISDYDEQNLYGTDPATADTDNDGFNDGIEIMRGYNPMDSAPEAVIEFESPRNSIGLAREDSLRVESVSPVITQESQEVKSYVGSQINGIALANSYVTIFIYSTPTVVSVRTDADGSFEYTFDKELEDGHHDVYVAVTDNAGKIIAQSNPFSFIKKAEAFTPVDAAEAEVITSDSIAESTKNTYGTVIGVGILALGIILLMLGISLRTKKEEDGILVVGEDDSEDKSIVRIIEKPVSNIQDKRNS